MFFCTTSTCQCCLEQGAVHRTGFGLKERLVESNTMTFQTHTHTHTESGRSQACSSVVGRVIIWVS